MGIKAAYEWFKDRVYPAPVAPFVEMVANAIERNPGEFSILMDQHYGACSVRVLATAKGVESEMVDNGVGLDIDFNSGDVFIVSYYLDAIPVNWRETRRLVESVEALIDAHEDAKKLAARTAANDELFNGGLAHITIYGGLTDPGHFHGLTDPAHNHPPGIHDPGHSHGVYVESTAPKAKQA